MDSTDSSGPEQDRALLISAYRSSSDRELCLEHLDELELLVATYGGKTLGKEACHLKKIDSSTYVGKGKLEELVALAEQLKASVVVFDDEIAPAQQRNLEQAFQKSVMDRTEVILHVFAQRAHTKEAHLQVELARLQYEAPRLKRLWTHLSRQHGTSGGGSGGGYLKGEGEKQIEIDRRILKRKLALLQKELEGVKLNRAVQRGARERSAIPVLAIVGYTNAGKSTLLNQLTGSAVFVEDKLFATLDTTTRKWTLKNHQEALLIDTVGFIRKLPHLLVAAFKSTLEEAVEADILIHLIDATHPMAEEQASTTLEVLKELGAGKKPIITALNKIDQAVDPERLARLRMNYPKSVLISAKNKMGFDLLEERVVEELGRQRVPMKVLIPQSEYALVSAVLRSGTVFSQEYVDNDLLLTVDVPRALASTLAAYEVKDALPSR